MAGRAPRNATEKGIDYAEFGRTGKRAATKKKKSKVQTEGDHELEDGQIADSPF